MPVPISRRIITATLLVAAAAGLALPALVASPTEPPLVSRVELERSARAGAVTGDDADREPGEPVPVVPRGERRDDLARSVVDDDDDRDDADDSDDFDGPDDGSTRPTGRSSAGSDDSDDGGSSGD